MHRPPAVARRLRKVYYPRQQHISELLDGRRTNFLLLRMRRIREQDHVARGEPASTTLLYDRKPAATMHFYPGDRIMVRRGPLIGRICDIIHTAPARNVITCRLSDSQSELDGESATADAVNAIVNVNTLNFTHPDVLAYRKLAAQSTKVIRSKANEKLEDFDEASAMWGNSIAYERARLPRTANIEYLASNSTQQQAQNVDTDHVVNWEGRALRAKPHRDERRGIAVLPFADIPQLRACVSIAHDMMSQRARENAKQGSDSDESQSNPLLIDAEDAVLCEPRVAAGSSGSGVWSRDGLMPCEVNVVPRVAEASTGRLERIRYSLRTGSEVPLPEQIARPQTPRDPDILSSVSKGANAGIEGARRAIDESQRCLTTHPGLLRPLYLDSEGAESVVTSFAKSAQGLLPPGFRAPQINVRRRYPLHPNLDKYYRYNGFVDVTDREWNSYRVFDM